MENIYIMSGVRTAIGKYGGSLKSVPAHTMGALVIREALSRAGIAGALVDEVILGEVRQSTEASNIARCALLEAGLPETVPGYTVNRLCASAMQAVLCGYQEIWTGQAKTVVAGGTAHLRTVEGKIQNSVPYFIQNIFKFHVQPHSFPLSAVLPACVASCKGKRYSKILQQFLCQVSNCRPADGRAAPLWVSIKVSAVFLPGGV